MQRSLLAVLLVLSLVLAGCTTPEPTTGDLPEADGSSDEAPTDEITVVAEDLDTIWEISFSPDGRVFFTERPGRIMVLEPGGEPELWREVDVAEISEAGLLGMALDPGFPQEPFVYACYTYRGDGGDLTNRISRFQEEDGAGGQESVLVDGMDGNGIHDGCRLAFSPDGLLHATMGDAARASRAQEEASLNGKTLRFTREGEVPAGNPFGNGVFTLGHRNPQGLAFHPETGTPTISEHGPENHDEVNVLVEGDNYGWPEVRGEDDGGGRFHPSIWTSGSGGTVAPAGAAFIEADGSPLDNAFVFGTLKAAQLHVLLLDTDGTEVQEERVLFEEAFGRLRAVVWGPDQALYLGTSNKDGRGSPGAQDDRIIRVPLEILEERFEAAS